MSLLMITQEANGCRRSKRPGREKEPYVFAISQLQVYAMYFSIGHCQTITSLHHSMTGELGELGKKATPI